MIEQSLNYKESLQKNFLDAWTHYLEFHITRHRRMIRLAGSPTRALIAEVIYWHELLILSEKNTADQFVSVIEEIAKTGNETLERYIDTKKLSITLISRMTGLPFETIRRQVKAMEADGLIEQSEAYGLLIKKDSGFHQGVSTDLVEFEQKQVVKLIEKALAPPS